MTVLHNSPILAGLVDHALHFVAGRGDAALFQSPDVDRVPQNAQNHIRGPQGGLLHPERRVVEKPLPLLVLGGCGNAFVVETARNVRQAQTLQLPAEHIPHHIGGVLVYRQFVVVLRVLSVAEHGEGTDEISPLALQFKLAPYLDGRIAAVRLVYQVLERDNQFIRAGVAVQAVKMVVDCDEADTQEGENLLDILSRVQVFPSEAGQVLHHDAVDLARPNLVHHLVKCRTVEVGPGKTVVHLHGALPEVRVAGQELTNQVFLSRDAVALLLVSILTGQADIAAGVPHLFSRAVHVHSPHCQGLCGSTL